MELLTGRRRRAIERFGFRLGCALAAINLGWGIGHWGGWLRGWVEGPAFIPLSLALAFLIWMTFQPFSGPWRPVVTPTYRAIAAARVMLGLAAGLFAISVALVIWYGPSPRGALSAELVVDALFFLMSVYAAVHWALRPERIFGVTFLRLINPWTLTRRRHQ